MNRAYLLGRWFGHVTSWVWDADRIGGRANGELAFLLLPRVLRTYGSSSLGRFLELGGRTVAAGSSCGRIRFECLVGDERSITAREAFEADGGGFVVKGSGGKSSRLGDWAASFGCSDM
jgi:hypothetical protein